MIVSILVIAGAFALWSVVHSFLASRWLKRRAHRALGESLYRWYRVTYVGFAVASLLFVLALVPLFPDRTLYSVPSPWRYLMMGVVQLTAVAGLVVSLLQAGVMHFLGVSSLLGEEAPPSSRLQVRGLYRLVRHPNYLFGIIFIWTMPLMTANLATLFACMTLYLVIGSYHE